MGYCQDGKNERNGSSAQGFTAGFTWRGGIHGGESPLAGLTEELSIVLEARLFLSLWKKISLLSDVASRFSK